MDGVDNVNVVYLLFRNEVFSPTFIRSFGLEYLNKLGKVVVSEYGSTGTK